MLRALIIVLLSSTAFAGDVRFNVNVGGWHFANRRPLPRYFAPTYVQPYYWVWIPYTPPPAPAPPPPPPPQIIYIEREPVREVVVVQLPPVEAPAPVVAAPAPVLPLPPPPPVQPAAPLGPRVPGPDVFHWTDEDGVVNYSTRVPPDARKRAKKLAPVK